MLRTWDNAHVGTGGKWEPLVLSTEFCCESQTALKVEVDQFLKEQKIEKMPFNKSHLINTYKATWQSLDSCEDFISLSLRINHRNYNRFSISSYCVRTNSDWNGRIHIIHNNRIVYKSWSCVFNFYVSQNKGIWELWIPKLCSFRSKWRDE